MNDPKKSQAEILIVEDEPSKRAVLEEELTENNYRVDSAGSPLDAEPLLAHNSYDVIVTDLRMPGQDGLSFLKQIKEQNPEQAVIVVTAYGTVDTAVEAMKLGAFDYLQKPFSTEQLLLKLGRLLRFRSINNENEAFRRRMAGPAREAKLVGSSEVIRSVMSTINTVADNDSTILIQGETGTGKDLAARAIHESSHRASGPFIAVSCAAMPRELFESELFGHEKGAFTGAAATRKGWLELAHGGTLFLDEVDDIPLHMQVKLLRTLQDHTLTRVGGTRQIRVNMRVIGATKTELLRLVEEGSFREDLYYRLSVVPRPLPPLRKHKEDIPRLIEHFLEKIAVKLHREKINLTTEAIHKLWKYDWPGNVRELEHTLERMAALSFKNTLDVEDVPPLDGTRGKVKENSVISIDPGNLDGLDLKSTVAETEKRLIKWAIERCNGNLSEAARMLNVPRTTLQYKADKP